MTKKFWYLAVILCGTLVGSQAWAQGLKITVLSSFPELVTGGDALVKISGVNTAPRVTVDGRDVSAAFTADADGAWVGLVDGLSDGDNALVAAAGGNEASVTLVNYPINGTLFAGPQQTPFICENEEHGLAPATDATCAAPTIVAHSYRSTDGEWKPFDPNGPRPTDIEMTTTSTGNTVPLIVWREIGVINRAAYIITLLHDPAAGPLPTPTSGTPGWNNRLIFTHRGGVGVGYHQGSAMGDLDKGKAYVGGSNSNLHEAIIRNGYALATSTLNVTGTTTNDVLQAETMAKVKERFIEKFGPPLITIGKGTSGGSMAQHLVANNYPGLFDGVMPWRSYPDSMSFWQPLQDCELLDNYFKTTEMEWPDIQQTLVSGKLTFGYCKRNGYRNPNSLKVEQCPPVVLDEVAFNPSITRPRCTWADNLVNVFGTNPETGFALSPWDNVGVQYGLQTFNEGLITFEQFIDLNRNIGGHDIDGVMVPRRTHGDPEAVRIAYETGRMQAAGGGLASIPMLDVRGYTDGICTRGPCPPRNPENVDVHDGYHTLSTRARLLSSNGNFDNQVRLVTTEVGHRNADSVVSIVSVKALALFDQWVTGIATDTSNRSAVEKMAAHKPADLVDACYLSVDVKITDMDRCGELFPIPTGDARLVAGTPRADNILKCSLQPVDAGDYAASLTSRQLARLQQAFPEGVCNWSKPGVGQVPLKGTWAFYTGNGAVEYLRPAH